jgi:hypothetical protein
MEALLLVERERMGGLETFGFENGFDDDPFLGEALCLARRAVTVDRFPVRPDFGFRTIVLRNPVLAYDSAGQEALQPNPLERKGIRVWIT